MAEKVNRDKWLFLICVIVAIVFWAMQKLSNNYSFTQVYSVSYIIPDGKVFKKPPVTSVEVTLTGIGWDIVNKSAKNIGDKIEVELSADNSQLIPATAISEKINSLLASDEISVAQIKPSNISISLVDQAKKKVPVVSKLNIEFLPSFYIKSPIHFTPDSVVITGSYQAIKNINKWNTEILNINKLNRNIYDMPIQLEAPKTDLIRLDHDMVRMNLEVEEFTEKSFTLPIKIKNADNKVISIPNTVDVKCVVGISKYDILTEDDIELYINLDESLVSNSINVVPISVSRMPVYIRNISYQPSSAQFFYLK
ncbi:MAG TPA: hypothetical protein PLC76_07165 [Saprospiraceae bacterium]|nr:MAG: hypothetical protein HWD63_08580 [Candidatus Parvibacillus calidus]HRN33273.1 hypothetical protein [Saprospiraceae bacterium]HRP84487.1 hypothetical protein [Saprospiraceae bacterium]